MSVKTAFLTEIMMLPLDKILPSKKLRPDVKKMSRYLRVEASVREVGVIEPLIVFRELGANAVYLLLDGHTRLEILRDLGRSEAPCLLAVDDESCTYNEHVNHIAPIQECRMILTAIADGVPEQLIAKALNVTAKTVKESKTQLADIAPAALEILKDKPIAKMALRLLKKLKPYRQIEVAELMKLSNTYTSAHARALFDSTPPEQMLTPPEPESRSEELSKLRSKLQSIEREFVALDDSYSRDVLNLQLARAFLKKLLANAKVVRYLAQKHEELLGELRTVAETASLDAP